MKNSSKNSKIWFLGELYHTLRNFLQEQQIESPQVTTELILKYALNFKNKSDIYINFDLPLSEAQVQKIREITKRRLNNEPIEYIIGEVDFYTYNFKIDKRALIPRPETEIIIDTFFSYFPKNTKKKLNVLDIYCGSGIIGLTLKALNPELSITLADINEDTLNLAKENASRLKIESVKFIKTNNFSNITDTYDVIVANPPYIPTSRIQSLQKEVKDYEPLIALDGGEDGIKYYREIKEDLFKHLTENGIAIFEYGGFEQTEKLINLFSNNFIIKEIIKDFNNIDRVIVLQKK